MKTAILLLALSGPVLATNASDYLPPQYGYPNIDRYNRYRQQQTQQELNRLAPKAATDPEAARRYRELNESSDRQLQILTDPNRQ